METTITQTKKNCNRETALEWSVGKGEGGGGVGGRNLNQFHSRKPLILTANMFGQHRVLYLICDTSQ